MHVIVEGTLQLGLVNVPVGVCSTVNHRNEVTFKTLHSDCGTPIKQKKWCPVCDVEATETSKGFEFEKGQFAVFSDAEIALAKGDRSRTIEILKFVFHDELSAISRGASYWLQPVKGMEAPYGLMFEAMKEENEKGMKRDGIAAFANASLWGSETAVAVYPHRGGLILQNLLNDADLIQPDFSLPAPDVKQLRLAQKLIHASFGPIELGDFPVEKKTALVELIDSRLNGTEFKPTRVSEAKPVDLMAALKETMAQMKPKSVKKVA